ncbi:hypothetical protein HF086_007834 [Spodoptera exigua]|uniref:acylaminoacyl-peptidase n=1 Tax=Spodoptera exigua TaxID=7107 RepID=A0A922M298_SPOEX|nr:hypothetical protein HF086_007834 [Spodoptera exigua]
MLKMSSQLDSIINAYKTLTKIPSVAGGKLNNGANRVTTRWSVRNLDKGKSTGYATSYTLDGALNVIAQSDFGTDVSNEILSAVSPRETFKALIREEKNGKDSKKQYLELWSRNTLAHSVRFSPDGGSVVGVVWETEPRRLGLIFCTNRPSYIFECTLDGSFRKLSGEGLAVRSPRFSPGGELVWLQRKADGPHHACHQLVLRKKDDGSVSPIIDIIDTEMQIANGESFHGVYCQALPTRCFTSDGSGKITDISNKSWPCSTSVLDVSGDVILTACSSLTTPGQVYVVRLPAAGSEGNIKWTRVTSNCEAPPSVSSSTMQYLDLQHQDSQDTVSFASLQVNYRGSTGAGQDSVHFLLKRVGDADVKDCKLATDYALKTFPIDPKKVCLTGGSHGGFLVTHLSGQYPDVYAAVVSRNPVTDVASMFNSTDIADWYLLANGFASARINYRGSIGQGDKHVRSLLAHVGDYDVQDCCLALDTLLERDSRLSAKNVFLYGGSYGGLVVAHLAGKYPDRFRALVMRNPLIDLATKGHYADNSDGIYMYEDNHSLSSPAAEMDNLINGAHWFMEHLNL